MTASLTARFEAARPQLGALAYRMLGSVDDAGTPCRKRGCG